MLVQFSMFPLGKGESVGKYVAKIVDLVDRSGLPCQTSAMSTVIEGEWDEIFNLIKRCRNVMKKEANRIYIVITIDDRKKGKNRIQGKVETIEKILKRKIKK
jgi:uncharacterized protein (TIGR00106 family)